MVRFGTEPGPILSFKFTYQSFYLLSFQYQEDSDVESLVNKLLAILDKPEKALLLRDIR